MRRLLFVASLLSALALLPGMIVFRGTGGGGPAPLWPDSADYPSVPLPSQTGGQVDASSWQVINVTVGAGHMTPIGCSVVVPDDAGDDVPNLDCALTNAPAQRIIYLPAGVYILSSMASTTHLAVRKSGHVLRGDGPGQTILRIPAGGTSYHVGIGNFTDIVTSAWTGGFAEGDTLHDVANAGTYTVGQWAFFDSSPRADLDGGDMLTHVAKVLCANGSDGTCSAGQVRTDRGLQVGHTGGGNVAAPWNPWFFAIEHLELDFVEPWNAGHDSSGCLILSSVAEGWVRDVKCTDGRNLHVQVGGTGPVGQPRLVARFIFEGNEFGLLARTSPWQKASVKLSNAEELEVVNNVWTDSHVGIQFDGNSSNVLFGYNRLYRPDAFENSFDYAWCERSIFHHGNGAALVNILIEGNDFECGAQWDGLQGPAGWRTIFYRNRGRITGTDYEATGGGSTINRDGVIMNHADYGGSWTSTSYVRDFRLWNNSVSQIGHPLSPTSLPGYGINQHAADMLIQYNVIRTANGCAVEPPLSVAGCTSHPNSGSIPQPSFGSVWENNPTGSDAAPGAWSTVNFRDSLAYSAQPSWWTSGSGECAFAQIGANVDNFAGDQTGASLCKLPAQVWFEAP